MDVLQIVQAAATVVGSGGVLVAAQAFRHGKRQETMSFEDALAREYREITGTLPAAAFFNDGVADLTPQEKQAMFRYFDLSNEQLRLIQKRRIDEETARVWTEGICELMNLPTFATTWSELEPKLPKSFFTSLNAAVASPLDSSFTSGFVTARQEHRPAICRDFCLGRQFSAWRQTGTRAENWRPRQTGKLATNAIVSRGGGLQTDRITGDHPAAGPGSLPV
jgi:hypothetical protein